MENTPKAEEFSPELQGKSFVSSSMKTFIFYILIFIALTAVACVCIFYSENVFSSDMGISDNKLTPIIISEDMDGLAGGSEMKIGISKCIFGENSITLNVYGKNFSDKDRYADGKTFVISSFNISAAETRYHYYADEWTDIIIPAHGQFECELTFTVENAAEKAEDDYIFSLSAFREKDDPTIEILLDPAGK